MSEHYYTNNPKAAHDETQITVTLRGFALTFTSDAAVFSRQRIDFGSVLLIDAMQVRPYDTVLDLGCGYGPIGTVAAKLAAEGKVYLVDVNERATALARRNLTENGVTNAEVRVGDGLAPVRDLTFDKILTNPPIRAGKQVIYQMVDDAYAQLNLGGEYWCVIQTKQGAPSMKRKLKETFGNVEDVERDAGFHVFRAVKHGLLA